MKHIFLLMACAWCSTLWAQPDTVVIGFGNYDGVSVSASHAQAPSSEETTINQDGFLPNENAASRFLSQATMGFDQGDVTNVMQMGIEDWLDSQLALPVPSSLLSATENYHRYVKDSTMNDMVNSNSRYFRYAWWQYHMEQNDYLRQKVAYVLSQLLVISEKSAFSNNPYALSGYYDIFLDNAFTNYRQILDDVTYHPSMGVYLTYLNNPKTDSTANQFPDENYAREIMQLFTIGTTKLNMDGTMQYDSTGMPIPTYDNIDIQEYSKVFTGLSWSDRDQFGRGPSSKEIYALPMKIFNDEHEPGPKYLLNGDTIPDIQPVDGLADIGLALDNLFNHPNTPPFVSKFLIQRMVTANPSPAYVERVANAFVNNGQGQRGDMTAIIKAILLDPEAKSCRSAEDPNFGMLKEPFVRYVQLNKGLEVYTESGTYRNDMYNIDQFVQQRPLNSPSVFNFFQQDYQPIGPVEDAGKVAPAFQITNSQTITGYFNSLKRFIIDKNIADESDLFSGEYNSGYSDEISQISFDNDTMDVADDRLHILIDRYNMLFAQGRLSPKSVSIIKKAVMQFPNDTPAEKERRVQAVLYIILTSPEYLISR